MKLEDKMKERLEERTIAPSTSAWDRIAGKLETQAVVKKSHRTLWLAIAASFIGGVIATLLILNQEPLTQGKDQLVINPAVESAQESIIIEARSNPTPLAQDEGSTLKDEVVVTKIVEKKDNKSATPRQEITSQNTAAVAAVKENKMLHEEPKTSDGSATMSMQTNTVVASSGVLKNKAIEFNEAPEINEAIDQQLNTIVASVDLNTISDEEIDALLKNAQREIMSSRVFDTSTGRVDANALLLDVEAEVDPKSFRDKVFEALSNGFSKARDAVVDRNN